MPLTREKVLNGVCLNTSSKHKNRSQHIIHQYRINLSETVCHKEIMLTLVHFDINYIIGIIRSPLDTI